MSAADNYVEDIIPDLSFELTLPYIMYRNTADEVLGCPDASASVCIPSSMPLLFPAPRHLTSCLVVWPVALVCLGGCLSDCTMSLGRSDVLPQSKPYNSQLLSMIMDGTYRWLECGSTRKRRPERLLPCCSRYLHKTKPWATPQNLILWWVKDICIIVAGFPHPRSVFLQCGWTLCSVRLP